MKLPRVAPEYGWHIALLALIVFCSGVATGQDLDRIFASARASQGKRPIIVIPGILGSELVNPETKEVVWPALSRSEKDGLTLPVSPRLRENRDSLVARAIVGSIKPNLLIPEIKVYQDLLTALEKYGGYRKGDWNDPLPDEYRDTYYVFPYDWRQDNVESARLLVKQMATLKAKLKRPDLRFNIVAHSMGGLVARYAARYGDADLPDEGKLPPPTWAGASHINKIFMFGTPNQGSASILRVMLKGYFSDGLASKIIKSFAGKMIREDAFSLPSLYQLLPHSSSAHFLDENLQPIDIDLYNAAVWRKYDWSVAADGKFREAYQLGKIDGDSAPFNGGDPNNLDTFLEVALRRAKRFHEALDNFEGNNSRVPLYVFGGDCQDTLVAPVLLFDNKKQKWITLTRPEEIKTSTGRKIPSDEVARAMYAPGDGRVSRRSLLGEDLFNGTRGGTLIASPLPITYSLFACSEHGDLPNNKILLNNALTALVNEVVR